MDQAKIRLSQKEMELLTNPGWILTKNRIMEKAWQLLVEIRDTQEKLLERSGNIFSPEVLAVPAKISRGENYKGLPYLILDHPRYFNRENILAIRTMLWWGHHFSVTLHLSGEQKEKFHQPLSEAFPFLEKEGYFVCIHESEWEHDFDTGNYRPLGDMEPAEFLEIMSTKPFLKLAIKIPLDQWDKAQEKLSGIFSQLLALLGGQLPRR
ncbi:MAG TPA: hypothetical protein VGD33_12500 [Chitinophagaceae bacterium]